MRGMPRCDIGSSAGLGKNSWVVAAASVAALRFANISSSPESFMRIPSASVNDGVCWCLRALVCMPSAAGGVDENAGTDARLAGGVGEVSYVDDENAGTDARLAGGVGSFTGDESSHSSSSQDELFLKVKILSQVVPDLAL